MGESSFILAEGLRYIHVARVPTHLLLYLK